MLWENGIVHHPCLSLFQTQLVFLVYQMCYVNLAIICIYRGKSLSLPCISFFLHLKWKEVCLPRPNHVNWRTHQLATDIYYPRQNKENYITIEISSTRTLMCKEKGKLLNCFLSNYSGDQYKKPPRQWLVLLTQLLESDINSRRWYHWFAVWRWRRLSGSHSHTGRDISGAWHEPNSS